LFLGSPLDFVAYHITIDPHVVDKPGLAVRITEQIIPSTGDYINQQGEWLKVEEVVWEIDNSAVTVQIKLRTCEPPAAYKR